MHAIRCTDYYVLRILVSVLPAPCGFRIRITAKPEQTLDAPPRRENADPKQGTGRASNIIPQKEVGPATFPASKNTIISRIRVVTLRCAADTVVDAIGLTRHVRSIDIRIIIKLFHRGIPPPYAVILCSVGLVALLCYVGYEATFFSIPFRVHANEVRYGVPFVFTYISAL